jgi:hypothetical protein
VSVDRQGVITALNVAAPVLERRESALEEALKALPDQAGSPLAMLGTVHFGRWSLIPDWPAPEQWTLWFSADFEGSVERFIAGVRLQIPEQADAIWSHCVDWPGVGDPAALERWIFGHRVPTHYFLAAYPDATLERCRHAHERRRKLARLAIDAQRMKTRADVLAAFRKRFGDLGA